MLLWIVFSLPLLSSAFPNIPLESKLTVRQSNFWVSPNGLFSLGFFNLSDQPDRCGVGILFNGLQREKTVVWSAGAAVTVAGDSYLLLNGDGDLVLFDSSQGTVAWKTNTTNSSVFSAALLDNGNFILLSRNQSTVWQSFDTPSDTLLPGQTLTAGQTLRAAGRNSVASYYTFSLDESGEVKLSWETNVTFWKSTNIRVSSSNPPFSAMLSTDGSLQLLDRSSNPVWSIFGADHGDSSVVFRFLKLDVDGNLRMYSLIKGSSSWVAVWQAVQNQCEVFATCGLHGLCFFNTSGVASCKCPFGGNPNSSRTTCLAPYKHGCSRGVAIITLKNTFLYGVYPPEESSSRLSVEECRKSCLNDSSCSSVTSSNDGEARCLMRKTPFVTGYEDPSLSSTSFVKICLDPLAVVLPLKSPLATLPPATGASSRLCKNCLAAAASAAFLSLAIIQVFLAVWFLRWRKKKKKKKAEENSRACIKMGATSVGLISLSFPEIMNLSSGFKHKLGPNSYRGILPSKQPVVIKELKGIEDRHFQRWVSIVGNVRHRNLAKVEAFCCKSEKGQSFLVFEFYKNGSVDRWRGDPRLSRKLTWDKRMEIFRGVARALSYLHSECREFIPHGNLSWSKVILDGNLQVRVTDYGLSKLCYGEGSAEDDVAKFGEMVVMLVTGKEVISAYHQWRKAVCEGVLDPAMQEVAEKEEVERALRIAFWCLQPDQRLRPSMGEVAKVLDGSLPVDPPPTIVDWSKAGQPGDLR